MKGRIEGFAGLEDTEDDLSELSHHGTDDQFGGFVIGV